MFKSTRTIYRTSRQALNLNKSNGLLFKTFDSVLTVAIITKFMKDHMIIVTKNHINKLLK